MDYLPDFHQQDKQEHALVGFALGAVSAAAVDRLWPDLHPVAKVVVATIPALLAGVAKEAYDSRHPDRHDCDPKDAVATVVGGVLGSLSVTLILRF